MTRDMLTRCPLFLLHRQAILRLAVLAAFLALPLLVCVPLEAAPPDPGTCTFTCDCDDYENCDDPANPPHKYESKSDCLSDRLACKHEALNKKLYDLMESVEDADLVPDNDLDRLHRAKQRAESARLRMKGQRLFKKMSKKQVLEPNCWIMEYDTDDPSTDPNDDGNNDGVCDIQHENCMEDPNDPNSDGDGICDQTGPKKDREVCLRICESAMSEDKDDNYLSDATDDVEDSLDDVSAALDDASGQVQLWAQMKAKAGPGWSAPTKAVNCDNWDPTADRGYDVDELAIMLGVAETCRLAYDVCNSGCNQDLFGANCSGVCVVLAVAMDVALVVAEQCELQDDGVTGQAADCAVALGQDNKTGIAAIQAAQGQMQALINQLIADVDALEASMNQRFDDLELRLFQKLDEIDALLNTPQGQRPDWPNKED